jgi:hypothetical protein
VPSFSPLSGCGDHNPKKRLPTKKTCIKFRKPKEISILIDVQIEMLKYKNMKKQGTMTLSKDHNSSRSKSKEIKMVEMSRN